MRVLRRDRRGEPGADAFSTFAAVPHRMSCCLAPVQGAGPSWPNRPTPAPRTTVTLPQRSNSSSIAILADQTDFSSDAGPSFRVEPRNDLTGQFCPTECDRWRAHPSACATVKRDGRSLNLGSAPHVSGLCRLRPGRRPVGDGILFWPTGAERNERGAHGSLLLLFCLCGYVACAAFQSYAAGPARAPHGRGNPSASNLRDLGRSGPVSYPVPRTGPHHGEPRLAHGGHH